MHCIIISGGTLDPVPAICTLMDDADLIVAADGGANQLVRQTGRMPHVLIGDMDSIDPLLLTQLRDSGVTCLTHPARKDQTDTQLCIEYALEQGADRITLLGATGSRLDHSLANIFLLKSLADAGVQGQIRDASNELFLIQDQCDLEGNPGDILSLIPLTETVTGVCLEGLEYPLTRHTLPMGSCLGVSNVFTGNRVRISVASGILMGIRTRD